MKNRFASLRDEEKRMLLQHTSQQSKHRPPHPFLIELGKGFALVDRQKHIHTEKEDYYIDLVSSTTICDASFLSILIQ